MNTLKIYKVIMALSIMLMCNIAMPVSATSSILDYKVGTTRWDTGAIWSSWASDGGIASVESNHLATYFKLIMISSEHSIEYQVGVVRWDTGETWSSWTSNGGVAEVKLNQMKTPLMVKVKSPDINVNYQVGTVRWDTGETWSPWASDGETASVEANYIPTTFSVRAMVSEPVVVPEPISALLFSFGGVIFFGRRLLKRKLV